MNATSDLGAFTHCRAAGAGGRADAPPVEAPLDVGAVAPPEAPVLADGAALVVEDSLTAEEDVEGVAGAEDAAELEDGAAADAAAEAGFDEDSEPQALKPSPRVTTAAATVIERRKKVMMAAPPR